MGSKTGSSLPVAYRLRLRPEHVVASIIGVHEAPVLQGLFTWEETNDKGEVVGVEGEWRDIPTHVSSLTQEKYKE